MILVNKEEAHAIRKLFPDSPVIRTMVQHSKRHHFYATETPAVLNYLSKVRNQGDKI